MLHVKRASAGSGKTYELAKMYIRLLLTIKDCDKKRRLGTEDSVKDALSSIMAVTFTVKATAEMKQRIVKSLAELAAAYNMTEEEARKANYMSDFMDELRVKHFEVARLAGIALRHMLLHYSDFKVQTIDSFFQSVLHTFAYEASLDDNFNMEIDSDYINSVSFDLALDSLSQDAASPKRRKREVLYWLDSMMKDKSDKNKWNVFARQEGDRYLYSELVKETANLEKEEFHTVKEKLKEYFDGLDKPFHEVVDEVNKSVCATFLTKQTAMRDAALELKKELEAAGLDSACLYNRTGKRFCESLNNYDIRKINLKDWAAFSIIKSPKNGPYCSLSGSGKETFNKNCKEIPGLNVSKINDRDSAFLEWIDKFNDFVSYLSTDMINLATWQQYLNMFPRFIMVLEIAARKKEFLERTNTMQISDTTHVLSRIIDKDDTPFVYERMGSRLNHYLIDEFQDTSKMQWENLKPLLLNSESFDYDNLIIGDAKQSIYRFRNADYTLIQNIGNGDGFHDVKPYASDYKPKDLKKENTNYRSKPRIVEFNNFIFSNIINRDRQIAEDGSTVPLFDNEVRKIYKDCVQYLPEKNKEKEEEEKKEPRAEGYVEICFHPNASSVKDNEEEKVGNVSLSNPGFVELTTKILTLRARGYDYRDIGILVQSHDQGGAVIKVISEYNNSHPENQIPVISEENLLVGSALSIRIIVHGLEMAARGLKSAIRENPILLEPVDEAKLFEVLKRLPALSLPDVVEAIAEEFVPEWRRNKEAPFIAAFQDVVLDYCATCAGDIGQFLKWWKRKSKTLTINSPEDSDGVKIQTIHKAKGLEFKCVIMPYAAFSFTPGSFHSEWKWIQPFSSLPKSELLPPYIPVDSVEGLSRTAHAAVRDEYTRDVALDELNKMYVGFTRPKMELYIYMPIQKRNIAAKAGNIIMDMLEHEAEAEIPSELLGGSIKVEKGEDRVKITYGFQPGRRQIEMERDLRGDEPLLLKKYDIATEGVIMQFENGNKLLNSTPRINEEGEETDPRAEGTLKHTVMQMVEYPSDLEKALKEMKSEGLIDAVTLRKWGNELRQAIEDVKDLGWFDERNRIINERPILQREMKGYRPDRIVIDADGNATVIDYKFGEMEASHNRQVSNYALLLTKSKRFTSVSAYLWYVSLGEKVKVI